MKKTALWLLGIVALCALLFWTALSLEERRTAGVMNSQLQGKAAELDRQLARLAVVPRLLAKNIDVVGALGSDDDLRIDAANVVLNHAQIDSNASFAFLLNAEGTTVASSNYADDVSFVGLNYGFRPYFTRALTGTEATFFAVGATTGVPGYFVANPITLHDKVEGVVVVKFELAGLLDSWEFKPYEWLTLDEFGVVVLSTDKRYLYAPTSQLSGSDSAQIIGQKRYKPSESSRFEDRNLSVFSGNLRESYTQFTDATGQQSFFIQQAKINVENWKLTLIVDRSHIIFRTFLYLLALFAVASILGLVYRIIRAQKRLAGSEKRYSEQLEHEVHLRTEELRATQQELISESNFAMLGRMSGAINHEINQPLASLRLNLASLRKIVDRPDADPEEVRQIVLDSDRTTKRIGRVVTTLRNLTAQRRVDHAPFSLERLVAEVVETVGRERPLLSRSLSVRYENADKTVVANEVLLQQALLNLLYNAFDAVIDIESPQVQLQVKSVVENNERYVSIDVSDNGCGVDPAIADSLFKPFVTDKARRSGLGLGLTLVELIAKEHRGQLQYKPACIGEQSGSIFTLTLPATLESIDE